MAISIMTSLVRSCLPFTPQRAKSRRFCGNPRGLWLLVEEIHAAIWVVSETRIHAEIQGKFLNLGLK